jgi:hypothetical protein
MNKKIYISLIIFFAVFVIGTSVVVFTSQKNKYEAQTQQVNDQISEKNQEISTLKADKDKNDYLPSSVVNNFMNELKNDSKEKAKLYVVKAQRGKDFAAWLDINEMLTQVNTTDTSYEITEQTATVNYTGYIKDESNVFSRVFTLVKEDDSWRISEIKEG